jgi:SAM-dependent methyltransferase
MIELQSKKLEDKKIFWDESTFDYDEHGCTVPRLVAIANEIKKTGYGNSVLELGCSLAVLKKILGKDFEYFGCDLSPSVVQLHNTPNIVECDLDSDSLPFQDKRFNYVVCSGVIEYLADATKFLRDIARSYGHERCLFLITVINAAQIPYRLTMLMGHFPKYEPLWINFYSLKDFLNLLQKQGFNVLRCYPLYCLSFRPHALNRVICKIFPSLFAGQFLFVCSSGIHQK